jgi:hypothetical protein
VLQYVRVNYIIVMQFEHVSLNGYRTIRKTLLFREANRFICSIWSVYIVYYVKYLVARDIYDQFPFFGHSSVIHTQYR